MAAEDQPPPFAAGSELLERAFAFARRAHGGPASRGSTEISHPVAVATILAGAGFEDDEVLAAALLHDVVEDTTHESADIFDAFGGRVGELVAVLTEDESIASYPERKAEHRERVLAAGRLPASIYLADKLARVRRYAAENESFDADRLSHYRRTVELYGARDPSLPFLPELRRGLEGAAAKP